PSRCRLHGRRSARRRGSDGAVRLGARSERPRARVRIPCGTPARATRPGDAARRAPPAPADRAAVRVLTRHRDRTARSAGRCAPRRHRSAAGAFVSEHIEKLVTRHGTVICCGSGGVGKTTTAAVLALEGARRGRHACVVTIDPAKRLANALGLEHLTNDPSEIDVALWSKGDGVVAGGRLSAMMLDTKSTFDLLVTR